jgi:chromosome partitioning protein
MAKILTVNSLKGGTGKTTLALNLYYYYSRLGKRVALADSDPQGSLTELLEDRDDVPLIPRANIEDWEDLTGIRDVDLIIIDTAPYMLEELPAIFDISGFILIPFTSSALDLLALNSTVEAFYNAQARRPALRGAVILTRGIHGTLFNKEARQAVRGHEMPILKTAMMQRVDYPRSIADKGAIFATENRKAQREIKQIGAEILKLWET